MLTIFTVIISQYKHRSNYYVIHLKLVNYISTKNNNFQDYMFYLREMAGWHHQLNGHEFE